MPTQLWFQGDNETQQTTVTESHPLPVQIGGTQGDPAGVVRVEEQFSYTHSAGSVTVTVKREAGFLHCITVNTTAASTITVYDNTAGSGATIAILKASIAENSYFYDIKFTNGLTIVLGGASDITVSWR